MAEGAQHAVLLVEQRGQADVHGVEGGDGLAKVCRAACGHDLRLTAASEALGGAGEVAQRPHQSQGQPDRRAQHDQIERRGGPDQPAQQPGIALRHAHPPDQPLAIGTLGREADVTDLGGGRVADGGNGLRLIRRPHLPRRGAGLRKGAVELDLELSAPGGLRHAAAGLQGDAGAAVGAVLDHRRAEIAFRLLHVGGDVGEPLDRRAFGLSQAQPLPIVEDQAEIDQLGNQQGRPDQHGHLGGQAPGAGQPHSRRTSAAST